MTRAFGSGMSNIGLLLAVLRSCSHKLGVRFPSISVRSVFATDDMPTPEVPNSSSIAFGTSSPPKRQIPSPGLSHSDSKSQSPMSDDVSEPSLLHSDEDPEPPLGKTPVPDVDASMEQWKDFFQSCREELELREAWRERSNARREARRVRERAENERKHAMENARLGWERGREEERLKWEREQEKERREQERATWEEALQQRQAEWRARVPSNWSGPSYCETCHPENFVCDSGYEGSLGSEASYLYEGRSHLGSSFSEEEWREEDGL